MNKKLVFGIDSGHGGTIDGVYQTYPDKMFIHSPEEIFYEGVSNRIIKQRVLEIGWDRGLSIIDLCPTELDVPLYTRAKIANDYYEMYPNLVLISLHSNAGGGHGFEIFTSKGETPSDPYAELLGQMLMDNFNVPFRRASVEKLGKEEQFYILTHTHCPAILPECLFFDNYEDYKMLIRPDFRERYAKTIVDFMIKSELVL